MQGRYPFCLFQFSPIFSTKELFFVTLFSSFGFYCFFLFLHYSYTSHEHNKWGDLKPHREPVRVRVEAGFLWPHQPSSLCVWGCDWSQLLILPMAQSHVCLSTLFCVLSIKINVSSVIYKKLYASKIISPLMGILISTTWRKFTASLFSFVCSIQKKKKNLKSNF